MNKLNGAAQGVNLIYSSTVVWIRCVHYIEHKDCTARFATGGIWEIPDYKANQVESTRHQRECKGKGPPTILYDSVSADCKI